VPDIPHGQRSVSRQARHSGAGAPDAHEAQTIALQPRRLTWR